MKLVEILAREMDKWPESASMVVQDKDCQVKMADGGSPEMTVTGAWVRDIEVQHEISRRDIELAEDYAAAIVTREMWEAERAKLARGEWNGEGLPPVGIECEVLWRGNWVVCEVLAHRKNFAVVYLPNEVTAGLARIGDCRPIRTPEQIAAQERERALDDIYRILRTVDRPGNKADMAEALYDAGYRKQEKD